MLAGGKTFVAIPGEGLIEFRDALAELLDNFGGEDTSGDMDASGDGGERERVRPSGGGGGGRGGRGGRGGGGVGRRGRPPPREGGDGSPQPPDNLPPSKEVRAEMGKTFYFDVDQNDRGTFIRLSEVSHTCANWTLTCKLIVRQDRSLFVAYRSILFIGFAFLSLYISLFQNGTSEVVCV